MRAVSHNGHPVVGAATSVGVSDAEPGDSYRLMSAAKLCFQDTKRPVSNRVSEAERGNNFTADTSSPFRVS